MKQLFICILICITCAFSMSRRAPEPTIPVVILKEFAPVIELRHLKDFNIDSEKRTKALRKLWIENSYIIYDTISDSLVNAISEYDIDNGAISLANPKSYTPVYLGISDSLAIAELTLTSLPTKSELVFRNLTLFLMMDLTSQKNSRIVLKVTGEVHE